MIDENEPSSEDENQSPPESEANTEKPATEEAIATAPAASEAELPTIDSDPLPEWEELTPELFEDECVRGDFMLRWASILLAVLLGSLYLTDTSVLVELRTGQYLSENGFLPPRTDPFAVATEGESWVNLHWLADLVVGTTQSLGGFTALTILTGIKLGLSFWLLSRIGYKGVSHWWGAICAVIAIIAIFPAIQAGQMSVTILGFCFLMTILQQWREKPDSRSLWALPVLFVLWGNMDPRAWLGLACLAIYLIVDGLSKKLSKQQLIIGLVALLAGILISPWPGQPALGYQVSLANMQQAQIEGLSGQLFPRYAYGMTAPEFWETPDVFPFASLTLVALAFLAQFFNASRLDWSQTLAWVGVNCLTLFIGELVPYAAIINCVVATLHGQDWYRHRFKNDYEITALKVFYARAGRAVTVLSFFLVAYAAINGFLMGPQGRRIGLGLDPRLANRLESTQEDLLPGILGDRVFNVRADQGDMLIWLGKKPYIDSRNHLFVNGSTHFAEKHRALRNSLFPQGPLAEAAAEDLEKITWQDEFKELDIQSVILRLWGRNPAYNPFLMLTTSRQWPLSAFGAAGAVFTRGDLQDEKVTEHLNEHAVTNFAIQAYRIGEETKKIADAIPVWPNPVTNYDKWLIQKLEVTPNQIQLARHYNVIAIRLQQVIQVDQVMGLATLALRAAAEGLEIAPNNPDAYRIFIDAQNLLQQSEQRFAAANGQNYSIQLRAQQALCHTFHAARASEQNPADLRRLFITLLGQQNIDTAQQVAQQYYEQVGEKITLEDNPEQPADAETQDILQEIDELVTEVKKQVEEARKKETPLPQLAGIAMNGRCQQLAISILEEDRTEIAKDPRLQLMYASLLLTNGRTEEAWEQLEAMQPMMDQIAPQLPAMFEQWKVTTAISNLVANVRTRPAKLFSEIAESLNKQNLQALLIQPAGTANPMPSLDIWPGITTRTHYSALLEFPERWANSQMQRALILLDQGELEGAKATLEEILNEHPEYSLRSLVVLYLSMMTGEEYEVEPPSAWIPIWGDMFVPDEEDETNQPSPTQPAPESDEKQMPKEDVQSQTTSGQGDGIGTRPPVPPLPERIAE